MLSGTGFGGKSCSLPLESYELLLRVKICVVIVFENRGQPKRIPKPSGIG